LAVSFLYPHNFYVIDERVLQRNEVGLVWSIDRSEVIDHIYYYENGELVLKPEHYDMHGWPPGEAEHYTPILLDCFDRGGWFYGFFDDNQLIGVAILESKFIGALKDQLQLKFLHVSQAYRGQGFGKRLFELACEKAREKGAQRLYISATPSEHTVSFYRSLGCTVTEELDPELFELEPEDIHLECKV
jgi:predicted N-acetyltransferase YhbS